IQSLARLIDRTMPEEDPDQCKGEDAQLVAEYIFHAFYSPEARTRMNPPKIDFARMTVRQYQNAVADLLGTFSRKADVSEERGLGASYYDSRNFRRDKKVFDRVEQRLAFAFGTEAPTPEMNSDEFSIRWRGSLIPDETG